MSRFGLSTARDSEFYRQRIFKEQRANANSPTGQPYAAGRLTQSSQGFRSSGPFGSSSQSFARTFSRESSRDSMSSGVMTRTFNQPFQTSVASRVGPTPTLAGTRNEVTQRVFSCTSPTTITGCPLVMSKGWNSGEPPRIFSSFANQSSPTPVRPHVPPLKMWKP